MFCGGSINIPLNIKKKKKKILFILRLQSTLKISITLSHTLILSQAAPNPERKIEF